jgi:hypothetical protein
MKYPLYVKQADGTFKPHSFWNPFIRAVNVSIERALLREVQKETR